MPVLPRRRTISKDSSERLVGPGRPFGLLRPLTFRHKILLPAPHRGRVRLSCVTTSRAFFVQPEGMNHGEPQKP